MESLEPFVSLGLALAIGLLIGFEREQSAPEEDRKRVSFVGGARTHPLVALLGAISTLVAERLGNWVVVTAFASLFAFLVVAYADDVKAKRDRGITSEMAFAVSFLLGVMAVTRGLIEPLSRRVIVLLSIAVLVTLILSLKPRIHALARKATKDDVFATLKFLIVAVIVLPLMPNETFGPLDVINPFKIGLMIVLIAGIDFLGYVAVRVLGAGRGLGLTGLLGGLVSSTAVTLSVSRRARDPALRSSSALAVVTASSVMFPRVLLTVAVVHRPLVRPLALPIVCMGLGGALAAFLLYRRSRQAPKADELLDVSNPFELSSALKFGLLFSVVLFLSKLATVYLGDRGTYLAGAVAGAADVDAIALSMADLAREGLAQQVAVTAIIIGAASNTVGKGVMAAAIGGMGYGKLVLTALGGVLAAGGLGLAALWLT